MSHRRTVMPGFNTCFTHSELIKSLAYINAFLCRPIFVVVVAQCAKAFYNSLLSTYGDHDSRVVWRIFILSIQYSVSPRLKYDMLRDIPRFRCTWTRSSNCSLIARLDDELQMPLSATNLSAPIDQGYFLDSFNKFASGEGEWCVIFRIFKSILFFVNWNS